MHNLKEDYITLRLALELDDVDSSLSTLYARSGAVADIEEQVDEETLAKWDKEIEGILSYKETRFSGGGLYNG